MGRKPLSELYNEDRLDPESNERLLQTGQLDEHQIEAAHPVQSPQSRKHEWKTYLKRCSLRLVGISLIIYTFLMGILVGIQWNNRAIDVVCLERISRPSPLTPAVRPVWRQTAFNGSLFKENAYRQAVGAEVDAAWEALGINYRPIIVPEEKGKSMGLHDHVRVKEKYGGGYPANVEGLHHLHCLNTLRQALYFNAELYRSQGKGAWKNDEWVARKHVTHCLDIIRQQLMCTVDTGVMGQIWVHEADEGMGAMPFVDFNTVHVCRDYDEVRKWAQARQVPADVPEDFLQPPEPGDMIYLEVP